MTFVNPEILCIRMESGPTLFGLAWVYSSKCGTEMCPHLSVVVGTNHIETKITTISYIVYHVHKQGKFVRGIEIA